MNERRTLRGAWLCLLLALGLALQVMILPAAAVEQNGFTYQHDPRLNPKAMEDIVADPNAVYGFSPSPDGSLKEYVDQIDWSDPAQVETYRQDRIAYHESIQSMYDMLTEMKTAGATTEEIARAVSAERNVIRYAAYENDPEGLAVVKARNLERYGREEGPTPDDIYQKYGSWEMVIEKAFSPNVGMDVCVGLYDDCYSNYLALGLLEDEEIQMATREYTVASFVRAVGRTNFQGNGPALSSFADAYSVTVWFRDDLAAAVASGLLRGYEDNTLRPGAEIARIEAFVLLSRCLPDLTPVTDPIVFTDVPDWAKADMDRLSAAGLVQGYGNGALGSADQLTVEQVGILMERLSDLLN